LQPHYITANVQTEYANLMSVPFLIFCVHARGYRTHTAWCGQCIASPFAARKNRRSQLNSLRASRVGLSTIPTKRAARLFVFLLGSCLVRPLFLHLHNGAGIQRSDFRSSNRKARGGIGEHPCHLEGGEERGGAPEVGGRCGHRVGVHNGVHHESADAGNSHRATHHHADEPPLLRGRGATAAAAIAL